MTGAGSTGVLVVFLWAALLAACGSSSPSSDGSLAVGVMLSYTGPLAADGVNSDRALRMAIEAANAGGGVGGHPLRVVARDTAGDPSKVMGRARELIDAGVSLFIGPDTDDLVIAGRDALDGRTLILPSFATSSDVLYKAPSWFVIGTPITRMACELVAQLAADGRTHPLVIANPGGYSASISWTLTNQYGMPRFVLPTNVLPSTASLTAINAAHADAYLLAAAPSSAVSLVYALLASGALTDPTRWYLSPTLHSPAFFDLLPKGALVGARGVAQGTSTDVEDFRKSFVARWQDSPLDDAYPFFDAGALAALSLQRALVQEGSVPAGTGLSTHIIAVTHAGGTPVHWNEIAHGLDLLRQGVEITYVGLTGQLEFDSLGQTPSAPVSWWTIGPDDFVPRTNGSDCH